MKPFENKILIEARSWIGTPYVHQASTKGAGTDCLGLIRGVWRALFDDEPEDVPPYSQDWGELGRQEFLLAAAARWLLPAVSPSSGDVLLFRMRDRSVAKHLGIAAQMGAAPSFIHAYSGHSVVESPLTGAWSRRVVARFRFPEGAK
ncbi:MAG: NlpC/P60 family protein [Pseudorhodobacter sp.]